MIGKKPKLVLLSVGVVMLAGVASFATVAHFTAIANDTDCSDPLAAMVRKEVSSGVKDEFLAKKMAELPFLERIEAKICARRFLTQDEINREHAAIKPPPMPVGGDQIPTPIPNAPSMQPNVVYDKGNPWGAQFPGVMPDTGRDFIITAELVTSWQGDTLDLTSGYRRSDPLQGLVHVFSSHDGQYYPLPAATGPAKILSINGSLLTVETLGGTYEKDEPGTETKVGAVTAPGGRQYTFDLSTRTFK